MKYLIKTNPLPCAHEIQCIAISSRNETYKYNHSSIGVKDLSVHL